jgi:type III restriction enzyme
MPFVKNAGLGFAISYFYNGEAHDYIPDFIVRLKTEPPLHLIIEVKGYDERADIKAQAAQKWVDAVSADGAYGRWAYGLAKKPSEVRQLIIVAAAGNGTALIST